MARDPKERPYSKHLQKSYTLRPADDEQRARWERRIAELGTTFSDWAREVLDRDAQQALGAPTQGERSERWDVGGESVSTAQQRRDEGWDVGGEV